MREFLIRGFLILGALFGMFGIAFLTLTLGPDMELGKLMLLALGQTLLAFLGIWAAITRRFE